MRAISTGRKRAIDEINARLSTIVDEDHSWLAELLPAIGKLISADVSVAYRLDEGPSGLRMEFFHADGLPEARFAAELEAFACAKQGRYAAFDPVCPQVEQRNVALCNDDIGRISGVHPRSTSTYRELLPQYGMERSDQLRALVCEERSLLAWVGGFRAAPFTDEDRACLDAIVPRLRKRLLLQRAALQLGLTSALVPVVLEGLGAPAFIVDGKAHVLHANSFGRAWLAGDRASSVAVLRDTIRGRETEFTFSRVEFPGARPLSFVWRPSAPRAASELVEQARRRWQLTPRQAAVTKLLALGLTNKAIGVELDCAEKTVELHVTAILKKAQVESRSALLAKIFTASAD
jgi:DNA-binding CsgD family transcriptional regulator